MGAEQIPYEIFVSYSRRDNQPASPGGKGWVTALRDLILEDHRRFSTTPLRIFFDTEEIHDMDDWRHRILGALRHSKILLVCLSPHYFKSEYCRWEWEEFLRRQVHQLIGADSIATVYFVEVPGTGEHENARWLDSITRGNFTDIRPWFPEGAEVLQREEVRTRMAALGESLWKRIARARRATGVPGNLRQQNPWFVGRAEELRRLHEQATGALGLVTVVHGLGGQGKTELAIAYGHGFADHYPAGVWTLPAEGKKELLPLIGTLAYAPELGYRPTDAEKNDPVLLGRGVLMELQRRATQALERDARQEAAGALLILDNVSDPALLSPPQLASLPRAAWLRVVSTTRFGPEQLRASQKSLGFLRVDSLNEDDAMALMRDHQKPRDSKGLFPGFASPGEEQSAREIVRELGCFTLAVEQVAVYLGLHEDITPTAYLSGIRRKGLHTVDTLGARDDIQDQMLHREKQLSLILETTLGLLDGPGRTALGFASLLPPDSVPWPWLKALTVQRHTELCDFEPDEPDPWLAVRRRLEGLRLLTTGDHPEVARVHRLVAAHLLAQTQVENHEDPIVAYIYDRAQEVNWTLEHPCLGAISEDWERWAFYRLSQSEEVSVNLVLAAVSYIKLRGDILESDGNYSRALTYKYDCMMIMDRLVKSNPSNGALQRERLHIIMNIAEIIESLENSGARTWWKRAYDCLFAIAPTGQCCSGNDEQLFELLRKKLA